MLIQWIMQLNLAGRKYWAAGELEALYRKRRWRVLYSRRDYGGR